MILVNGNEIKVERFPNGETLIRDFEKFMNPYANAREEITMKYESDQDILNLIFVKKHIDNEYNAKVNLHLMYVPYSRMDRTEGKTVFTLKYVCEIINSLGFETVLINEPHSDVCVALLDRCVPFKTTEQLYKLYRDRGFFSKDDYIVFPDASADKRYNKIDCKNRLTCIKHRDFETGKILSLEVLGEKPEKPFKAVIVDDLCSRGGTFIMTAHKLRDMGATDITLIVTHCENTIYEGDVFRTDVIDRVITTNSILRANFVDANRLFIEKMED